MSALTPITIIALLLAAVSLSAAPGGPDKTKVAKGFIGKAVEIGGQNLKYVVYVPAAYDPAKPMPTIVFLNGSGECGTDGWKQLLIGLGSAIMLDVEKWPFIVVFPQKQVRDHLWEQEDEMVMSALDQTRREYSVDPSRIYLTGLSQGGHGTWAIAAEHPDLFAAIAPICGWGDEGIAKKVAKLPTWVFHGGSDDVVKTDSSRDMAKWIDAAGGTDCKLTIYPDVGHGSWDKVYREEELGKWLLEHQRHP